jgi:cell division inhibitor SulA
MSFIICCDLNKVKDFLVSLELPVESVTTGNTGVIVTMSRELTQDESDTLSRVVFGQFGVFLAPEGTEVVSCIASQIGLT